MGTWDMRSAIRSAGGYLANSLPQGELLHMIDGGAATIDKIAAGILPLGGDIITLYEGLYAKAPRVVGFITVSATILPRASCTASPEDFAVNDVAWCSLPYTHYTVYATRSLMDACWLNITSQR